MGSTQDILNYLFSAILLNPDKLAINPEESIDPQTETYSVSIPKDEMGKVIGSQGSVIKAIRLLSNINSRKSGKYLRINLQEV